MGLSKYTPCGCKPNQMTTHGLNNVRLAIISHTLREIQDEGYEGKVLRPMLAMIKYSMTLRPQDEKEYAMCWIRHHT